MKVEIKVPAVGESVTEAIVALIIKPSGSFVHKDEEIIELETDKVNQVVYAPASGLLNLTVNVDENVAIGQSIGFIETDQKEVKKPPEPSPSSPKEEKGPLLQEKEEEKESKEPLASKPLEHKTRVSVSSFVDSLEAKKSPPPSSQTALPSEEKIKKPKEKKEQIRKRMSGLRRVIAKKLVEVKNQTAMLTTFNEVDMSAVMEIRYREKEAFFKKQGVKLGFMSFFVKATVAALKELPEVHAFIEGDEIVYNTSYDIGISVSTDKGLMVPVVRCCDRLSFADIEKEIQNYAKKAREGLIAIEDLKGGSFTITNGGVFGSMLSTPILNPPQSAILGMHNIVKRPLVIEDKIVVRPIMYLALSYDHRIVDGKEAVTFLVKVKDMLEKPDRLLLDF